MLGFYNIHCNAPGEPMPQLSRRTFIAGMGALVTSGTLSRTQASASQRVIVIGAGLAGLAAAYELKQAGVDVMLIEQSKRAGGRIKTIRGHFADDAWVDVGGQTSGGGYANFFYYSTLFGLPFEEQRAFPAGGRPDVLLHLEGQLFSGAALRANPGAWPLALEDEEKPFAPTRLLNHYLGPVARKIATPDRVLEPEFVHYDELSLLQFLQQQGASKAAIGLIDHTLNYNSVDSVSALSALRDAVRSLQSTGGAALNLENGNMSLVDAFVGELGNVIRYDSSLTAITQDEQEVTLQVETNGQRDVLYADFAVLAIPFTALRKVDIDAGLPTSRQKIINQLPYTQIVQAYLQTSERFWERDGPVAMVYSDGPLERLFNASARMNSERGLLVNWVNGSGLKSLAADDPEEYLERVIGELDAIWPDSRGLIEKTYTNNWGHSYAEGAYAHYAPGQMAAHAAEIPQPVGRLHFAGEHTELVAPGMEGALTSGKRAAQEILKGTAT